jgi:hypothetical protein
MIRQGFVGIAGAVVVAAVLAQASVGGQSTPATKAPAKSTTQKAAPAPKPADADAKTAQAPKPAMKSGETKNPVPATTPTPQPTSGAADEPKTTAKALGSVSIPKKVMADGKPLAAGSYTLRLTGETGSPVVGQTQSETRWIEFVQGSQVKGRELATVLSNTEAKTIAKQGLPAGAQIQTLVGNDYLRVWINRAGTNYLLHLTNQ